ncbi:transposase [Streptomyces sp. NBC_00154]|uniref:transposase n=1 Tax=Streptomyces sp. NBC_00154 TaxID=2975670 RepID=UPI00338ED657
MLILFLTPYGSEWPRCCRLLPSGAVATPGGCAFPDRVVFAGVMYVLRTGVAWRDVPAETVGCSGVTAWRRLRDWTRGWRVAAPARGPAGRATLCRPDGAG